MTNEQISVQLVAINDAIQILARSGTTVQSHTKEIDNILATQKDYSERIRDIESLIHQSCDLKTKEMQEQSAKVDEKLGKVYDRAFQYAWQFSAVVGGVGLGMFYYVFNVIETKTVEHTAFEATQEEKTDKIFSELFTVMREIRTDVSDMKADMAVMKTNVNHYQETLQGHMAEEERKWRKHK